MLSVVVVVGIVLLVSRRRAPVRDSALNVEDQSSTFDFALFRSRARRSVSGWLRALACNMTQGCKDLVRISADCGSVVA